MNAQQNDQRTLFIASDHAGFVLKSYLLHLWNGKVTVPALSSKENSSTLICRDLGPPSDERVDYPDYAQTLCREFLKSTTKQNFGILICGSGQGMAMSANRFPGIRAALAWNQESARLARAHNDANILCLGARLIEPALAASLVETFLRTPFEEGRHSGRIAKIESH